MKITESAPIICATCEKVFYGKYASYCPECLRKLSSERAKRIGLNKLGNEAYSKKTSGKEQRMSKIDWDIIDRLTRAFPNGFINGQGEFVAHRTGEYFILRNCETELDIKCKVLEWFSRAAYKTEPYGSKEKNDEFHAFMLRGINLFLGTRFTQGDMEYIYTYLGNAINHEKTVEFITEAQYNMGFFQQFENRRATDGKAD